MRSSGGSSTGERERERDEYRRRGARERRCVAASAASAPRVRRCVHCAVSLFPPLSSLLTLQHTHTHISPTPKNRFAYRASSLLDYACGRGGDLHKWRAAQVAYVKGVDLSAAEVREAERRYGELAARERARGGGGGGAGGGGLAMRCDFEQCEHLGDRDVPELEPFDAVTCMFALHYFFSSEATLATFLRNVAGSLKPGGYFLGTVPDGRRVMAHLSSLPDGGALDAPLLRLVRRWGPAAPKKFGSAYTMEIRDTVVEGVEGASEGSDEFLVFTSALVKAAAAAGLHPVADWGDPQCSRLFEEVREFF